MPVYVYEVISEDGSSGERFEIVQSMKDSPLTSHPESGLPVRRVMLPPNIASRYTPGQTQNRLENKNVEKAGFTKYERDKSTGTYHKTAGRGNAAPDTLRPD